MLLRISGVTLVSCYLAVASGCDRGRQPAPGIGPFDAFEDANVLGAEGPPGPERAARKVELSENEEFAPLSGALRILVEEVAVELARPASNVRFRIDFFREAHMLRIVPESLDLDSRIRRFPDGSQSI